MGAVIAALMWTLASIASAQNFPRLEPGRLVYGMPNGYVNPVVGEAGARRLDEQLHTLHHPFFVIFLDRLPGDGDPNVAATHLLENLVTTWRANQPDLCPPEASAFLQITTPRKYRLTAGSRWVTQLNLDSEQATRFGTEHFVPYMRLRPEDPMAGILGTARAMDDHIFQATDPEVLRQRQEAAERLAEQNRRAAQARAAVRRAQERAVAHRELGNELYRARRLLANEPRYLPSALDGHSLAVQHATATHGRPGTTTQDLRDADTRLKTENDAVESVIDERKSAETFANVMSVLKWVALFATLFGILITLSKRRSKLSELRLELSDKLETWQSKIDHALVRYVNFDEQRDTLRSLATKQGQTGKLFRDVTGKVDTIFVHIEAMRAHLNTCATMGAKGWLFNADHLRAAIEAVDATFLFDTDVVDQARLFHPQTVQVEINPATIESDLASQFTVAMAGWKNLQEAYNAGDRDPRVDLPMSDLDALRTRAQKGKVPNEWPNQHPLAQNPEDTYLRLTSLRGSDPVAYCAEVTRLQAEANRVATLVDEIIELVAPIFKNTAHAAVPQGTIVEGDDDPSPHVEAAMRGEGELSGLLKALRPKAELEAKVEQILHARNEATEKAEIIRSSVHKADEAIKEAGIIRTSARGERDVAERRMSEVRTVHAEVDNTYLTAGTSSFTLGEASLEAAELALKSKRHVMARRLAVEAGTHFQEAMRGYGRVRQYCNTMDQTVIDAQAQITSATGAHSTTLLLRDTVGERVTEAGKVHSGIREVHRYTERADNGINNGEGSLREARKAINEKRYLKAKSLADEALQHFRGASAALEDANQWINEQDRNREAYIKFVAEAGRHRSSAEGRIRGANRKVNLAVFRSRPATEPVDYVTAMAEANAARLAWDKAAQQAEDDYAREQRRAAEEAAAARRRDDDARRAASYSSSSSSSSYDSGGSSVGGGDYGGGGGSSVGGGDY